VRYAHPPSVGAPRVFFQNSTGFGACWTNLAVICSREESGLHGNPLEWRWVNELGMHNAVDARELVEALVSGRMTPHVWVWRTGWKTWVRASQVADLATAIPKGARLPPVAIEIDPAVVEPPSIPHYSFHDEKFVRHASTPIPSAMHQRQLVRRPQHATLVDRESTSSVTLRPPGAVPPPPRTFFDSFAPDVQRALDLATFASDNPASAASTFREPSRVSQRPSVAPKLVPTPAPDFVIQSVLGDSEPPPLNLAGAHASHPSIAAVESQRPPAPAARISRKLLIAGVSLVVIATSAIVGLRSYVLRKDHAAVASTSSAQPRELPPCRLAGTAERIAPNIVFNVPPFVETTADGRSLAVGFADNLASAAGITVDPVTLSVKYAFRQASSGRVATVVPRVSDGQLSFVVSLDSDVLKDARPVAGPPPFTFAHNVEGFVRQLPGARTETIWPTDIDAAISGARLVTVDQVGHAVTYRQGGVNGSLWVGWLTQDGQSKITPFAIPTDAKRLGQPSIAANDAATLVTYAGRLSDKDHWQVHLAKMLVGGRDPIERTFEPPAGGPGGDSIAPSAVGLDGGRFLLQWSEGAAGHWQVRIQTLNENLQPMGSPINASPAEMNAGQGLLWVNGSHAVSLFVVNVGRSAELWAASLDCPR